MHSNQIKLLFILLFSSIITAQNNKVIDWVNQNAIALSDRDFKNDLNISREQLSPNFINAIVFGFGEATHHNKEFFEMKSKFFKYLVQNQEVRVFVIEESFGASHFINEYLMGNGGDLLQLMLGLKQGIWQNQEVFELISWMKSYNDTKTNAEKIQFYGNDCMFNYGITAIIKDKIQQQNIAITSEEKALLDFFSKQSFQDQEKTILQEKFSAVKELGTKISVTSNDIKLRDALKALEHFSAFLVNPNQETRDRIMAEIVEKIHNRQNAKIFVWTHNDHVKKTVVYKDKTPSMGNWLHQKYKDRYYAMGFEFGIGKLFGFNEGKKAFENVVLEEPIKNTNSEFFFNANHNIFYFDFKTANQNEVMNKFLSQKRDYIQIGAYGLVLKYIKYNYISEKYNDMYDGLIYIKKISPRTSLN
ncbi:erythromycin esterase [Flavobacterium arsenatis]|uniref:Erythromycin esterase n=1 Tax=Flavobacterium arsenatis TaxID=1484332 RepID=A0ABU1TST8_9FLAO|nr:erythromycin esterase family protein [Flavobacterium arsenatis]MDR6968929.1 erythromycin esterase [Flavobacterium arsenatis]